jgi:hypothetical protein
MTMGSSGNEGNNRVQLPYRHEDTELLDGAKFFCSHLVNDNVGHPSGPESDQYGLILSADVLVGFGVLFAPDPDDGSEDANSLFSILHATAKLVPRIHPRNACC